MKRIALHTRRLFGVLTLVGFLGTSSVEAQLPTAEERLKILTDPESLKSRLNEKEKTKPPIEFFRSQIAPFDILPFVKANHWSTLSLEMRSNYEDYAGVLQTSSVRMLGIPRQGLAALEAPQEVIYRREARLLKQLRARLGLQIMLPRIPKEITLELTRPDAIRVDEVWQATLRTLEPHQMLILVLSKDSTESFARWNRFQWISPVSADHSDVQAMDKQRYYRLVLPLDIENLPLSGHPLTWTSISHVIWDGLSPEMLDPREQQAMLDWLHWGGQLVVVGGAKPSFSELQDSFLGPYLPAEPNGENVLLNENDLKPLSQTYRPPYPPEDRDDPKPITDINDSDPLANKLYLPADDIHPASNRPVFLAGLRPVPGASSIPLGESSDRLLAVEHRVGRGRIQMLGLNPIDPALTAWTGLDTFVRRVLIRRPEEPILSPGGFNGAEMQPARFAPLAGPELSWYRLLSRDLGASLPRANPESTAARGSDDSDDDESLDPVETKEKLANIAYSTASSVAEWVDSSALPTMSRDALEEASGISIPSSWFVLKVILAYVIALVPLNWLICRYVLGRRELAWLVVPTLSLAFAIGVERAAAYDLGYDAACDEIDVLETFGDYPRAHLSRFASLYATGRVRFTISFPNDVTALALPQDIGRSLRGEDITSSTWQSLPFPALEGFQVQPRSLALFRTEQMVNLSGAIRLVMEGGARRVVNGSDLDLKDAVLVDVNGPDDRREIALGTIAAGATVEVKGSEPASSPRIGKKGELNPLPFLDEFRSYAEDRSENKGEIRLVAWTSSVLPGAEIEPKVDRHRGFTAVVVHLRNGPPPAPDSPRYDYLARDLSQLDRIWHQAQPPAPRVWDARNNAGRRRVRRQPGGAPALPTPPGSPGGTVRSVPTPSGMPGR